MRNDEPNPAGHVVEPDASGVMWGNSVSPSLVNRIGDGFLERLDSLHLLVRYPMLWAICAFLIGGCLASTSPPILFSTCAVSIAGLIAFGFARGRANVRRLKVFILPLLGLSMLVVLGFTRARLSESASGDALSVHAARKAEPVVFRAEIERAAIWRPNPNYRPEVPSSEPYRTQWNIRVTGVRDGASWRKVNAFSILHMEGRIDDLLPGDEVEVFGSYRKIYKPTNPGAFDLAEHYSRQNRFVLFTADSREQVRVLGTVSGHLFARMRAITVNVVDRNLRNWVSQEQSPLAAALVFGQREQVDWEDQQQLMATGTLHMLAISGMHVEIVALGVLAACAILGTSNLTRFVLLSAFCLAYAGLADAKPPVVRAATLVIAFEFARFAGKNARLINVLAFAGFLLCFMDFNHASNVGVHLSFLAVSAIGIFVLDPRVAGLLPRSTPLDDLVRESYGVTRRVMAMLWQWLRGMTLLSFWVWLITAPLIWWHFHLVAPIGIVLNVLLAVPLALGLFAGLISGLLGGIPGVGPLAGNICGSSLQLISSLVDVGASIPLGHVWLPRAPLWWIGCFYVIACVWLLIFRRKRRGQLATCLVIWLFIGVSLFAWGPRGFLGLSKESKQGPQAEFAVTFLDVGHGTSVIVELPNGKVWLYDAGHLGVPDTSHQEIAAALWQLGTCRIDTLILSHADSDHYNAVAGLADRFQISQIVSTPQFWQSDDPRVVKLIADLDNNSVPFETWKAGSQGAESGVSWKVLHPAERGEFTSDNASSLCLLLEFADVRILLPGDLEGSGLADLVELPPRPCQVLMAPHHGSLTLDPSELLIWCQPELVVVSGNHRANRTEVVSKYASTAKQVGVTFRDGAIRYAIRPDGSTLVQEWGESKWREFSFSIR